VYVGFFHALRDGGVPTTLKEYLTWLEALAAGVAGFDVERFYYLARASLCKDERHLDRFDRVFAEWFEGVEGLADPLDAIPEAWLRALGERWLSEEDRARIEAMGGWSELLETLRRRLAEQQGRHEGGSRWIGTGGTSPFGAWGFNPMGVRIGQYRSRHRRAVKVWDRRAFRDFDDHAELGTRHMKLALRRLRRLTREGRPEELDLDGTIRDTARRGGFVDVLLRPARRNGTKVVLLLDVGGSMDDHVTLVERLFTAARAEFAHLEPYDFHNCPYERVWRRNARRRAETVPTAELLRTYGADWRCVLVGDASMSPYELLEPGGSVEHWNEEAGVVWLRRVLSAWERAVWINPTREEAWDRVPSIGMVRQLMGDRMVPLTLSGIEEAVRLLKA